ncbi:MAG: Cof-type HAD-IIB family hydrolase [Mycoplasmataceae bacterium]|nr:Cof-type HAD-IIB family hydrolase [Mycoplasmataceae bacterium]
MNKKLIFTDLDGTLLNTDKKISEKSEKIIKAFIAQGHYFCFVTGRSLDDALPYYRQLGLNTICICNNGAAIHNPSDPDFDDIFFPINNHAFFKLWACKQIQSNVEYFVIKTKHNTFFNKLPTEKKIKERLNTLFHIDFNQFRDPKKRKHILIYDKQDRRTGILSMIFILKENTNLHEMYYIIKSLTNNLLISHWSIDNRGYESGGQIIIELNHNFANKLNSLKFAQSYYDVLWADTIVFGDGENDVEMLNKTDNSWAMRNANLHALSVSRNITTLDNNHDGVALTLDELFMPK